MDKLYSTRSAIRTDASQLGKLHKIEISSGFLSSLNDKFLTLLYENIIDHGVVYVVESPTKSGQIIGFVSCVESTKKFYIAFLRRNFIKILPLLFFEIFRPRFLLKALESLKAPFKKVDVQESDNKLDCPELLSITVSGDYKRHGLGLILLNSLEGELRRRGVLVYKVVAGESLRSANSFYKKNEFKLHANIVVHKGEVSNIYIKEL